MRSTFARPRSASAAVPGSAQVSTDSALIALSTMITRFALSSRRASAVQP